MARILYITNGMASTLNSSLELSRRLKDSGNEVVYLSHLDLSAAVEAHGFRFFQLNDHDRLNDEFADMRRNSSFLTRMREGRRLRLESLQSRELEDRIGEIKPDMLVIDIELHFAVLVGLKTGIPMVTPIVWFSIFKRPGLPPMNTELMPPVGAIGMVWNALAWSRLLIPRHLSILAELTPRRLLRRLRPIRFQTNDRADLKAVAREKRVSISRQTSRSDWMRPQTYPNVKVLSYNAIEMEFPHTPHENIHYVGPMVHHSRRDIEVDCDEQEQLSKFLDRAKENGQSVVYCSLGTYWATDRAFLSKVVAVFKRRDELALVIGLGGRLDGEKLSDVSDNVLAMGYAPQLEILKHSAAAICHGGITTINECIENGVPVIVCSTGHVDQPGCAARIEYHKLGVKLDIKAASPGALEQALDKALKDAVIVENVTKMQERFAAYKQTRVAEKLIDELTSG
ncbi:MAG: glycosyltransferase [Planctomycetota bacterium]